jgi:hypothetical protein
MAACAPGAVISEIARQFDVDRLVRIPAKPAMHSNLKPATDSELKPATWAFSVGSG